jgi:DNA-binding PadR family transcriptional regulator
MSTLLLDERPLQVLPNLAKAIGLHEALFVQQLYWLLREPRNGRELCGKKWIFNTVDEWLYFYFPFMTRRTFERMLKELEDKKLVESIQPEGRKSRRKYYRLADDARDRLSESAKMAASNPPKRRVPKTKTSIAKTSLPEESSNHSASSVDLMESPEPREAENLTHSKPLPSPKAETPLCGRSPLKPTREEFDKFIEEKNLEGVETHRDYDDIDWKKARDWRKFVLGLEKKIQTATTTSHQ